VLILGAEGQVGQIATQAARLLGASRVVGAVRTDESRQLVLDLGADAAVSTADLDTLTERLRAVVGDGVDLIIDLVWGPVIAHALDVARLRARAVQVGNSGAALATLSALGLRNKLVSILPHTNWPSPPPNAPLPMNSSRPTPHPGRFASRSSACRSTMLPPRGDASRQARLRASWSSSRSPDEQEDRHAAQPDARTPDEVTGLGVGQTVCIRPRGGGCYASTAV